MGNARKRRWSYSAGERGRNRVRAYEDNKTETLFLEFYEREPGSAEARRKRVSLKHCDRDRAKQQADETAARLAREPQKRTGDITLHELFDIYGREVTLEKGERQQEHDRMCSEMFGRFFGPGRKANTLNLRDWDRFIRERRSGRIRPGKKRKATKVGDRTIARDLKWLLAALNWATLAGDGHGGFLLERNPLKGLSVPTEKNPKRPVMTEERYQAMLAVAPEVDWRFEVALTLAHETGHRIGAIRHLRWSDLDLVGGFVRWRGESDKSGREHRTPLTPEAVAAFERVQHANPAIGNAWVLPAPKDSSKPVSRHLAKSWWRKAGRTADLEHLDGMGWHSLRRKFVTERKNASRVDICAPLAVGRLRGRWRSATSSLMKPRCERFWRLENRFEQLA
jgi:integrase